MNYDSGKYSQFFKFVTDRLFWCVASIWVDNCLLGYGAFWIGIYPNDCAKKALMEPNKREFIPEYPINAKKFSLLTTLAPRENDMSENKTPRKRATT
jgi:hypothetical protein